MSRIAITPQEMRAKEQAAFDAGVSSLLLMETAARRAYDVLRNLLTPGEPVLFLCGPGNNGGDGLAIARMWKLDGGDAHIVMPLPPRTPDAQTNLEYAQALGIPVQIGMEPVLPAGKVLVDALFGTGFGGAVAEEDPLGRLMTACAVGRKVILAIDVPSGMDALTGAVCGACIPATHTVTFQWAKQGLLLTRHKDMVGNLTVADIGLTGAHGLQYAQPEDFCLPQRSRNAHKGDCGRVALYCGSEGMAGAAVMAARAALRAGSGLVTVITPRAVLPVVQTAVPCAMARAAEDAAQVRCDARLFGCGMAETEENLQKLVCLHDEGIPEVWDAGALNLLAASPMVLGKKAVITPHAGEAARLLGWPLTQVVEDPLAAADALRQRYGCYVALKSATTVLASPDKIWGLNTVGSPALAKGGSGDALAGILVSLLGQGMEIEKALEQACLWHGLAGCLAGERYGIRGAMTDEVIDSLAMAERKYMGKDNR